jgi:EAL domain-containing protein (putative c-di-GMP-specific phosphodiesterase class I)
MSGSDEALIESVSNLARKLGLELVGSLQKPFRLATFKVLLDKFRTRRPQVTSTSEPALSVLSGHDCQSILDQDLYYPVYQPQVDAEDGLVNGVECLCRLKDEGAAAGVALPTFLKSLGARNLIHEFTKGFINKALKEVAGLFTEYPELRLSFNIDALSLKKHLVMELIEAFSQSKIPLSQVTFEITESNIIRMDAEALFCVSKLRSSGANLSIDDFGTGFSTIQSLIELPFNELKIDRTFVAQLGRQEKVLEIIRAMQGMSERLHFNLVCEGVETKYQRDTLQNLGCSQMQGYLYSQPLALKHAYQFIAENRLLKSHVI